MDMSPDARSPLERLLDPAEFDFLQQRGLSGARIYKLRVRRRKLFRMYMRRLTIEFNTAHAALKALLVSAEVDRPDLVRELGRQRILFYRGLLEMEVRLMLHALGFTTVLAPSLSLIRSLEGLHAGFRSLMPDLMAAHA
jgi:hypothetical protein